MDPFANPWATSADNVATNNKSAASASASGNSTSNSTSYNYGNNNNDLIKSLNPWGGQGGGTTNTSEPKPSSNLPAGFKESLNAKWNNNNSGSAAAVSTTTTTTTTTSRTATSSSSSSTNATTSNAGTMWGKLSTSLTTAVTATTTQLTTAVAATSSALSNNNTNTTLHPALVFIHGFMGSKNSFRSFTKDLPTAIQKTFQDAGMTSSTSTSSSSSGSHGDPFAKSSYLNSAVTSVASSAWMSKSKGTLPRFDVLTYDFETHGDNTTRVHELVEFLEEKCTVDKRPYIILIGHSMGGLLAADAARAILLNAFPSTVPARSSTHPIRIKAVLAFDSPFFGLHPHVLVNAGAKRVTKTMEDVSRGFTAVSTLLGPTSTSNSSASSATSTSFAAAWLKSSSTSSSATTTSTSSGGGGGGGWGAALGMGLAVAAAGVAAASHPVVQSQIQKSTEAVKRHAEFLGPLWKVDDQNKRLDEMIKLQQQQNTVDGGVFKFKCFYMKTPSHLAGTTPASSTPTTVTFINPPSTSSRHYSLFEPVLVTASTPMTPAFETLTSDEVEVHINMFDAKMGPSYIELLQLTAESILEVVSSTDRSGQVKW